jgi:hypothetical protein
VPSLVFKGKDLEALRGKPLKLVKRVLSPLLDLMDWAIDGIKPRLNKMVKQSILIVFKI